MNIAKFRSTYWLLLLFLFLSFSCTSGKIGNDVEYTDIWLGENTGVKIRSIGAEFDPHFFAQNVTRNADAADWDIIVRRITAMQLQSFRVMILPEWYEPVNDNNDPAATDWDNLTFNNLEMQSLYKVLDLAQQNNIKVNLVLWGCATNMRLLDPKYADLKIHFLSEDNSGKNWVVAPKNIDEWCENFSILVQYLLNEKKYDCIKEITPINEPSWAYIIDDKVPVEGYIEMCKKLDERFKADNIRDKVLFNLSDDAENAPFLEKCTKELAEIADLFNSHTYKFGYETKNSEMIEWEEANLNMTKAVEKEHFIGEFGSNQTLGSTRQADIDLYERGVLMVRIALNMLNAGASGISYWSLIDQYYNKKASYQEMQQLGLWRYKKKDYAPEPNFDFIKADYEVRPQYHAYALLSRFIKPASNVYPISLDNEFATGSAFLGANNKWTYIFANASKNDIHLSINNKDAKGKFNLYKYTREALPIDDSMIQSSGNIRLRGSKLKIDIPAESVVVYRQD